MARPGGAGGLRSRSLPRAVLFRDAARGGRPLSGGPSMKALTLCALLVPFAALADSPFDGTWVSREDSAVMDPKPYVISLAKGTWENKAAAPAIKVKADGTDQPV